MVNISRIVLVTGGNRGIGLAIVHQFQQKGYRVYMGCRDTDEGEKAIAEEKLNEKLVTVVKLDVSNADSIAATMDRILGMAGRLDILVNNAGILQGEDNAGLNVQLRTLQENMMTNVYGPLLLSQKVIPHMKMNNYGRIINMSTDMSIMRSVYSGKLAYRMSKASLNVMTKVLATEVAGENILINAMSPGWVKTRMGGAGAPRTADEAADTALYLATLPDGGPSGCFFKDKKIVPW